MMKIIIKKPKTRKQTELKHYRKKSKETDDKKITETEKRPEKIMNSRNNHKRVNNQKNY